MKIKINVSFVIYIIIFSLFFTEVKTYDDTIVYIISIYKDPFNPKYLTTTIKDKETDIVYDAVIDINNDYNWIRKHYEQPQPMPLFPKRCSNDGRITTMNAFIGNGMHYDSMPYVDVFTADACSYPASLALGMKISNPNPNPLMKQLSKLDTRELFGIVLSKKHQNQGTLYVGDLSGDLYNSRLWSIKCYSNSHAKRWNCPFEGIILGELHLEHQSLGSSIAFINPDSLQYYSKASIVFFETIHRFIIVPRDFFDHLINEAFNTYINKTKDCILHKEEELTFITCHENVIQSVPKIHFIISQSLITFPSNILFEPINDKEYRFLVVTKDHDDDWVFGNTFLQISNIIIDYNTREVYLNNKEGNINHLRLINENQDKGHMKLSIFIECLFGLMYIMSLSGILLMLIALYRSKHILEKIPIIK